MNQNFTPRLQQILIIMLRKDSIISVKNLAENINVSKRTIQRELEYLGNALKKYDLEFCSKTGIGVWIEGTTEAKKNFLLCLEQNDILDISDRIERRKRLTLEILKDKTPKKLYYYSNLFGVSEATISTDLEAAEQWLSPFQLHIIRKQGYGILIEGSEKDYRQAIRTFIDENIDTQMVREIYEDKKQSFLHLSKNKKKNNNIYEILNDEILHRVISCILYVNDKRILNLTETSYTGLLLHVTIAVHRIIKQEMIEENEKLLDSMQKDSDYELAVLIAKALEKEFDIKIPNMEIVYICLHIGGSKRQLVEDQKEVRTLGKQQTEFIIMIHDMIDAYDAELAYALKQDEELIQGLLAHLQPTCIRLTNGMKIRNPILEQIQKDYKDIYEKCFPAANIIQEKFNFYVPEAEIGFLAIHFGAAVVRLENRKERKRKVKIGIICASGIGISRLMSSKIARYFMDKVEIDTYGQNDLTPYIVEKNDFFVSSISMPQEDTDILFVNPLLVEHDMSEIEKRVRKYERMPKQRKEENEFTQKLDKINYMAIQIKSIIKNMILLRMDNHITFDHLLLAIGERLSPYHDRRNVIQEDIKRRETLGTQIFPEYNFALLHTRTKGVIKPSFSICLTKDLDAFFDPYFKNIRLVIIMLLPMDEHMKENSEIFGYLSEMLIEDYHFLDTMMGGNQEEIRELISSYLKQFFNQYLDRV